MDRKLQLSMLLASMPGEVICSSFTYIGAEYDVFLYSPEGHEGTWISIQWGDKGRILCHRLIKMRDNHMVYCDIYSFMKYKLDKVANVITKDIHNDDDIKDIPEWIMKNFDEANAVIEGYMNEPQFQKNWSAIENPSLIWVAGRTWSLELSKIESPNSIPSGDIMFWPLYQTMSERYK